MALSFLLGRGRGGVGGAKATTCDRFKKSLLKMCWVEGGQVLEQNYDPTATANLGAQSTQKLSIPRFCRKFRVEAESPT